MLVPDDDKSNSVLECYPEKCFKLVLNKIATTDMMLQVIDKSGTANGKSYH